VRLTPFATPLLCFDDPRTDLRRRLADPLYDRAEAIAAEVRRTGAVTLLVEDDMDGPPVPPEALPGFLQALDGQGLDDVRIAYVEAIPERLPKVELAEILARERGFTVRVFANRMDAAVWLRHGER